MEPIEPLPEIDASLIVKGTASTIDVLIEAEAAHRLKINEIVAAVACLQTHHKDLFRDPTELSPLQKGLFPKGSKENP